MFHRPYRGCFLCPPTADGHERGFHLLPVVNTAAVNTDVPIFFKPRLSSPRSRTAGHTVTIFNFSEEKKKTKPHHTALHSSCTILHSLQQCIRVPISPHSYQYWLGFLFACLFWILAQLMSVTWYFIVVSICIFLMTSGSEYLFMYLLLFFGETLV